MAVGPLRSPWVLPAPTCQASSPSLKSLLLLSNAPHTRVSASLPSCSLPEIPSLSPLAASLPGFVISLGSPPPCCSVHAQLPQNPSARASAYPPKFQTSSETPCLPVSLRTLASLKSEFLVCVSVDCPCTSKCLAPGGIYICSVNSQQTLSLL